ncbi:hypothetical protein [Gordonia otitidis]|uniref:Protein RecA n=1 Tax=Gordonia otitidis (strain DSM 44809 / CCUG 52243 / JCM 12355 / NBRC 100426 / IFM 10032) TaxID=1108044 RepID=H5TLZ0_GORO1|nr:hypothetical protein [Gordonia otitidis]UEA59691.1 hypothetical protein LK459_01995 [Gordonia otitidis]GAB34498.1 hypothetical protein GOOTI_111_00270 [Gordonia otitidis NBRC 100426]
MSVLPLAHPCPSQGAGEGSDGDDRADTLARLRKRMAVLSGMPDRPSADRSAEVDDSLPLPDVLADLLPRGQSAGRGGIARGSVVGCSGARSLVVAMIAAVSRGGGQVGIVGLPWLNLLSAAEMGADLARIATVPDPGVDPVEIASVLLDGMDLVVLGLRGVDVAPARCRVVSGRVRQHSSALMVVDGHWPGAQIRMEASVLTYRHVPGGVGADLAAARRGHGRIGGLRLQVTATGRDRRSRSADVDLSAVGSSGGPGGLVGLTRPVEPAAGAMDSALTAVAN